MVQLCKQCRVHEVAVEDTCIFCLQGTSLSHGGHESVDTQMRRSTEGRRICEGFVLLNT